MQFELKNTHLWFVICILFVFSVAFYSGYKSNSFSSESEIIIYPVQCDDWLKEEPPANQQTFQNCHQRRALNRVGLKIDKTNNTVVNWFIDEKSPQFSTAKNCSMADSNNWSCNNGAVISAGANESFGLNNGNYFNNAYTGVIFVSKSEWNSINNGAPTPLGADVPNI